MFYNLASNFFCSIISLLTTASLSLVTAPFRGEMAYRFEVAPAYVHVDVVETHHTVKEMDFFALKADATFVECSGYVLKPTLLYSSKDGEMWHYGAGLGICVPIMGCMMVTPLIGLNYTELRTNIDLQIPVEQEIIPLEFHKKFTALSPYLGVDLSVEIGGCMRVLGYYHYAWPRTHTKIKDLLTDKTNSRGPVFGGALEYDIFECLSVNVGLDFNHSLDKDKHGIRFHDIKAGLALWF